MSTYRIDTITGPETHPNLIDTIYFEKMEEWVFHRVLTLMCSFVFVYGPYGWRLDSTFRKWVILPLTCTKWCQDGCEVKDATDSIYRTFIRTWNTSELDVTHFFLRWRSESCTEYWLWCVVLCVGADRTADVSTRRLACEWSCPWHVWSDVRTSVKCVKDGRCRVGSHLVRLQTYYTGLSR